MIEITHNEIWVKWPKFDQWTLQEAQKPEYSSPEGNTKFLEAVRCRAGASAVFDLPMRLEFTEEEFTAFALRWSGGSGNWREIESRRLTPVDHSVVVGRN